MQNSNIKVSIIIPVYNAEQYLEKCLNSVVNQTLEEIEIICVNDGSTDNSLKILNEYAKKDERIKIISQENQGYTGARNVGINNALGKYIMFIDNDDYYELNACEDAYNYIIAKEADICAFGYYVQCKNQKKEHHRNQLIKDCFEKGIVPDFAEFTGNPWSKIYKKQFLDKNGLLFPENLIMADDTWFDFQCMYKNAKICYLNKSLYTYYFDRIGSATVGNKNGMKYDIDTYEYVKKQPLFIKQSIENQLKFVDILFGGGFYFYNKVSEKRDKRIVQKDIIKYIEMAENDYNKEDLEQYCPRYFKIKEKFMPKVSIIIPVYNVEQYLKICLDSVVNQTLENIEIICIDDCSTDNSLKILEEYAQNDERIVIIKQEKNQGKGVARNKCLDIVKGEYIGFVDPDDWVETTMFEKMYNQAKKLNSDIVICDFLKHKEETGKSWKFKYWENAISSNKVIKIDMPSGENIDKELINKTLLVSPCCSYNRIYKTNIIKKYDIKFSGNRCYEDVIFVVKTHILSPNISYLKKNLYNYLIRKNSTLRNYGEKLNALFDTRKNVKSYLKNINYTQIPKINLKYFIIVNAALIYLRTDDTKQKQILLKQVKGKLNKEDYEFFLERCEVKQKKKYIYINYEKNHKVINILGLKVKLKKKSYSPDYPIDIVYCWVDGNDEKWQKEKLEWQRKIFTKETETVAIKKCRFVDNEELRYSLRSIAKNAPWINHIYIVTNGQIPKWLNPNHPKITIVNHKDIMPEEALPTFNSEAIETCIYNIPNLSEHFLYANDDMFIYSKIKPEYFFDENGNPIVRMVKHHWKKKEIQEKLYNTNVVYSLELIKNKYGKKYKLQSSHNIDAYNKTLLKECQNTFKAEFDKTTFCKFRTPKSVQRVIYYLYLLSSGNSKLNIIKNKPTNKISLEQLLINVESVKDMEKNINKHKENLKLLCINDNERTLQENREKLGVYLSTLFPDKQKWEK